MFAGNKKFCFLRTIGNYGAIGLFDWLHGTDQAFRKTIYFQRHRLLTSLKPVKKTFPGPGKKQELNNNVKMD